MRTASIQGPASAAHFAAASSRIQESRAASLHVEGGYFGKLNADDIDAHDVVHNEKLGAQDDQLFAKVAVKEQLRQQHAALLDETAVLEGLDGEAIAEASPSAPKQKAMWALRMEADRCLRATATRLAGFRTDLGKEVEARATEFEALFAQLENGEDVRDQFHGLKGKADFALKKLDEVTQEKLDHIKIINVQTYQDREDIDNVINAYKGNGEVYNLAHKEVRSALRAIGQLCIELGKQLVKLDEAGRDKGSKRRKKEPEVVLAKLLVSTLDSSVEAPDVNVKKEFDLFVSTSTKCSRCVRLPAAELKGAISSHRYTDSQKAWCAKSMAKTKQSYVIADVLQAKAGRDFTRFINTNVAQSSLLLGRLSEEGSEAEGIYKYQYFSHDAGQNNVSLTPYGLPEARLLLSGEELIIGVKCADAPGATMRDKIKGIYDMALSGENGLMSFAQRTDGFVARSTGANACLIVIPVGHIIINLTLAPAFGLRWSFMASDFDHSTIKEETARLVVEYPETNTLAMQALFSLLRAGDEDEIS